MSFSCIISLRRRLVRLGAMIGLLAFAIGVGACNQASPPQSSPSPHATHSPSESAGSTGRRVPAYHADVASAKPFPQTLDPANFTEPYIRRAYQTARDIPEVLAQQPCYCYCDMGPGKHGSLLDCHVDTHSAG